LRWRARAAAAPRSRSHAIVTPRHVVADAVQSWSSVLALNVAANPGADTPTWAAAARSQEAHRHRFSILPANHTLHDGLLITFRMQQARWLGSLVAPAITAHPEKRHPRPIHRGSVGSEVHPSRRALETGGDISADEDDRAMRD